MLTIDQIQREAYATALEKGWHDRPLCECEGNVIHHDRVLAKHALMHTELTEAQECSHCDCYDMFVDNDKPEGFSVEMADVIVRICDTAAALDLTLNVNFAEACALWTVPALNRSDYTLVSSWLSSVRMYIDHATEAARIDDWSLYGRRLSEAVSLIAAICKKLEVDLDAALTAKMAYNKTRPHRHGGKNA